MKERGQRWEAQQREKELLRRIDTLGTENTRLRKERNGAIRARYEDQEEAMVLRNQLAARDADVKRLETLLGELERNLAEGEEDELRQRLLKIQLELAQSQDGQASLQAEHGALQVSFGQLSQNNRVLQEQIGTHHDVEEEAKGLRRENRFLSGRNNLLRSQVGSYMVGNRITMTQFFLQAVSNIPLVGRPFRKTSEQIYDQTHQPRRRR